MTHSALRRGRGECCHRQWEIVPPLVSMCSLWWAFVPDYIWQYHDCAGGLKCCANQYWLQNKPPSELVLDVRLSREILKGSECLILSQSSLIINSGWLSWWLLTYDNHRHVSAHLCFWLCQELKVSQSLSICSYVYKVLSRDLDIHFISLSHILGVDGA